MTDLLDLAIKGHGGQRRWQQIEAGTRAPARVFHGRARALRARWWIPRTSTLPQLRRP
jgi:hypothetical protein